MSERGEGHRRHHQSLRAASAAARETPVKPGGYDRVAFCASSGGCFDD
jgi:hypothetical protein